MSKSAPAFEPWEVDRALLWAMRGGVAHVCESIARDLPHDQDYVATFSCGFTAAHFTSVTIASGFNVRAGLRRRRCRRCVAAARRQFPSQS